MSRSGVDHASFRKQALAFRSHLLDDEHERAMLAHLESCAECRLLMEQIDEGATQGADGTHIPPSVLARWEAARRDLTGLERAMVARHLERCADCRQELELLGHEPHLEN